jgi:uncharacterized membrane protein YoaK (UPF0700 family)
VPGDDRESVLAKSSTSRRLPGPGSAAAERVGSALPFVLSLTAGSTDIIGFLGLNGLFTSHITGNIVVLAAHIVTGDPTIFSYMLSVPVFMLALFLTRLFAGSLEQRGHSTLRPLLLLQLLLLIVFLSVCVAAGPWRDVNATPAVIAGMSGVAAMAVQNALVQISLTSTPTTAVMTTNVTHFMLDLGEVVIGRDHDKVDRARNRVMHNFPVIIGFTIGCAAGAAFEAAAGLRSLTLPTGLALLAFVIGLANRSRPP